MLTFLKILVKKKIESRELALTKIQRTYQILNIHQTEVIPSLEAII
jgi:hypothetical protein